MAQEVKYLSYSGLSHLKDILEGRYEKKGHTHSYLPLAGGTMTGVINSQSVIPTTTKTYNLGSSSLKWANVYAINIYGKLNGDITGNATSLGGGHSITVSRNKLTYLSGQYTNNTTETAGQIYIGSSANWDVISSPMKDGTDTLCNIMSMRMAFNSSFWHEIATTPNNNEFYHRSVRSNGVSDWRTILDSVNYSNYALPKSGGTLTGNLIAPTFIGNLSGNASSASKLSNTTAIGSVSEPVYFTANGVPAVCSHAIKTVAIYDKAENRLKTAGWYRIATLKSYGSFLLSISGSYHNINSTAASFIINKSHDAANIQQLSPASVASMITKVRLVNGESAGIIYVEVYNNYTNETNGQPFVYRITTLIGVTTNGSDVTIQDPVAVTHSLIVKQELTIATSASGLIPAHTHNTLTINGISADTISGNYMGIIQSASIDARPSGTWYNVIKILHSNSSGYYTELAQSFTGTEGLYHRRMNNGAKSAWRHVLDSTNYTDYCAAKSHTHTTLTNTEIDAIFNDLGVTF